MNWLKLEDILTGTEAVFFHKCWNYPNYLEYDKNKIERKTILTFSFGNKCTADGYDGHRNISNLCFSCVRGGSEKLFPLLNLSQSENENADILHHTVCRTPHHILVSDF